MRSRWVRAIGGLLTTVIAIVAIAVFIFLIFVPGCTQTQFEVFAPAPYSDGGMPPHAFAQQDREAFRSSLSAKSAPEQLKVDAKQGTALGARRGPLLLYVTALAGRTDRGVVLYSMDSGPDEQEAAVPLDQLWAYLAAQPADQKKVLAIDIARGPTDARWGQFVRPGVGSAGSGGAVQLAEAASRIPNLAVITSAAPGEVSWTSPVLARSVFAHFLIRALAGEADGVGGTARDYRITLDEVHTFLLMHVNHWVLQNRDLRGQHPLLVLSTQTDPGMRSMVLGESSSGSSKGGEEAPRAADGAALRRLESLWEGRDKWSARGPVQTSPLEWAKFQEHLRRAESWRLAGQIEGMAPHLDEAEAALRNLETQSSRSSQAGLSPFIAAGLARRTAATPASTDPPLPEQQLASTLKALGPEGLDAKAKSEAVRLRASAEQSSWQPYRTRSWTGRLLDSADESRRLSEDLLFVGTPAALDRSRSLQSKADQALTSRAEIVRELSEAHALHARLLSELPALATWASERMPVESLSGNAIQSPRFQLMNEYSQGIDESRFRPQPISAVARAAGSADDAVLQQAETDLLILFESTRQLARVLDRELSDDRDYSANANWRTELQGLRRALTDPDRGLEAVQSRLTRHAKGLVGATVADAAPAGGAGSQPQYFHWLRVRNALQWNGLTTELRKSLYADLEQSDRTLNSNSQKVPVGAATPWNGDDWTGVDGCWRSLWALQSLSLGMGDTAMHEHWVDWKNAVVDPMRQIDLLVELGQSVRREYRGRLDRAQPDLADRASISELQVALLSGVRAERTFHGYDAVLFSSDRDPLRRFERVDLATLCLAQANRYADDFWGKSADSEPDHWFVQAAQQCLKAAGQQSDAISLAAVSAVRTDASKRLNDRLAGKLQLALPPDRVDLSLTTQRATTIGLTRSPQVPPGIASLWVGPDSDGILKVTPATRQGAEEANAKTEWTIRKEQTPPAAMCGELALRPKLLFRGRFWDDDSTLLRVNPCPPEALEFEFSPPAATGKIVVNGADRRDTIFILDCSFSMTDPLDPKNKGGDTRFQAARKALTDALRVLRDQPALEATDPYVIGLMAYGHRARTKGGDYFKTETNPDWKQAIPATVSDDWRNDFELLSPPLRLVDDRYQQMLAQLKQLQPFGQTPLLGAINSAARTLLDRQRGGVVVAITDGAYNDEKRQGPRFKALQDLFESHPELALHVVAFGIEEKDEITLLKELAARTQGKFYEAPTGNDLALTIGTVMKPRQYSVARSVEPREEQAANLGDTIDNRPPRNYVVRFPGFANMPVTIFGGELLQFELDFAANQLKPRRPPLLLFRRAQNAAQFDQRDPTRLGYLRADYDNTRRVATLELGMDRDDLLGAVDRPAEVRFKVVSRADRRRTSRSWRLSPDRSIPAWLVELKGWASDSQPEIEAIWKMTRTAPDQQLRLPEVLSASQTAALPGWPNRAITIAAEQQPGRVLVRLQADPSAGPGDISDVRVELGQLSMVEGVFLPQQLPSRSRLYEKERQITWEFEVPDGFKPENVRIGLTSAESLDRDARRLESPLVIEKWDREL